MVKVKLLEVAGVVPAIVGMRKSHSSEKKMDSFKTNDNSAFPYVVGKKDLALMKSLIKEGASHSKFLRTMQIWLDIKAPISWWVQFDTYHIGVTRLSESTMHRLVADYKKDRLINRFEESVDGSIIDLVEQCIEDGKDITELRDNLPMGFILGSIINLNYQTLLNIIQQREGHKNTHWEKFISQAKSQIPLIKDLTGGV